MRNIHVKKHFILPKSQSTKRKADILGKGQCPAENFHCWTKIGKGKKLFKKKRPLHVVLKKNDHIEHGCYLFLFTLSVKWFRCHFFENTIWSIIFM